MYGIKIITPRTFYSSLEHIINTTIIVYGFYRYKLFKKGNHFINIFVSSSVAVASHGLFDFFLMDTFLGYFTAFFSIIIYLIGINFWIQMLNNANNYSDFFDYTKINYSNRIFYRLLFWYSITILITFLNNLFVSNIKDSILHFLFALASDGFLFLVVMLRASRFKIYRKKYFEVRIELPFYFTKNNDEDFFIPLLNIPIKIRGENQMEHIPTKFLNKKIVLTPLSLNKRFLMKSVDAKITDKFLLFDDVVVYSVIIDDLSYQNENSFLLKPKTRGLTEIDEKYPIEGLYRINKNVTDLSKTDVKSLQLLEWVCVKF